MNFKQTTLASFLISYSVAALANPIYIGSDQRESISLTLYNQQLGLVLENRQFPPLNKGQKVILEDVSEKLQTESLRIKNAGQILEQNLNKHVLNQYNLLDYYRGKTLQLARFNPVTGQEAISNVKLLNVEGNRALIQRKNRFETITLDQNWRFIFPSLPQQLLLKPSLNFRSSGTSQKQTAQISYLSSGLDWDMDYVLTMSESGKHISLDGLASLTNQTGMNFTQANIKLLAGEINRPQRYSHSKGIELMSVMADTSRSAPREKLQDFHLYSLPWKTDLLHGQVKQVSLLAAKDIRIERGYNYTFLVSPSLERKQHKVKPELSIKFKNTQSNHLGMPLPAGNLRTFAPDSEGHLQFIGGSSINHTATGNDVKVKLGKAFDLTIQRKQTHYSKTFDGYKVSQELRITNSTAAPAQLELTGNFPLEWKISRSSHPYQKVMGGSARWLVDVPAKGDTLLTFNAEMTKR